MNPMTKAVNSLFNHFGTKGMYEGREVLVILSEPDEVLGVGFVKAHTSTTTMRIRVSDAPDLKVGDRIYKDDDTYVIHSEPVKDIHALIWSADLICN